MDGYSGKRGGGGLMPSRKGYNVTFKDASNDKDQNPQSCNRTGCNGRIKYMQNTKNKSPDKAKCPQPSFYSSNEDEIIGTSSSSSSITTRAKRSLHDSKRTVPSQLEFDPSSSRSGDSEAREVFQHKFVPSVSQSSALVTNKCSSSSSNRSKYGLRKMKCNSISDVVVSSSESKSKGVMKKRSQEGESSRGRKTNLGDGRFYPSSNGISISDSCRARRSMNVNNTSYRQNGRNGLSLQEPDSQITIHVGGPSGSSGSSSYSLSTSNGDNQIQTTTNMSFTFPELGFTRFVNRDALQRFNMDGIAEVLLALERIEQDEELTNEQVLALETGLFLSGLNLYDQHRDMRLDIDSMSYEELLALEERMGTVSTALPEEALFKCLEISVYEATPSEVKLGKDEDDIKCSICQEEYIIGDEIGQLVGCQHGYHDTCINQWLQVKNWCPICKATVAAQQYSFSS